jgi:hypothetical protein
MQWSESADKRILIIAVARECIRNQTNGTVQCNQYSVLIEERLLFVCACVNTEIICVGLCQNFKYNGP